MNRHIITLLLLLVFAPISRAQVVAVNTDLAMDALMTPSLGVEFVTGNSTTLNVNALANYKPLGKDMKCVFVQPEVRLYPSRRTMYHEFIGVCGIAGNYEYTNTENVRKGYGLGLGLTIGYVMKLSKHLNLDLHAGYGLLYYVQKKYKVGDPYDELYRLNGRVPANDSGYLFVPTRVGVSLSYIIR